MSSSLFLLLHTQVNISNNDYIIYMVGFVLCVLKQGSCESMDDRKRSKSVGESNALKAREVLGKRKQRSLVLPCTKQSHYVQCLSRSIFDCFVLYVTTYLTYLVNYSVIRSWPILWSCIKINLNRNISYANSTGPTFSS